MRFRTLGELLISTGADFYGACDGPHGNGDGFTGLERDDQVRAHRRLVYRGRHHDLVTFNHLICCTQGDFSNISRHLGSGGRSGCRSLRIGCIRFRCSAASAVFRHFRCTAWIGQGQRRSRFHHAGQAHKGAACTTTTGQCCSSGFQLCQRILALIDGGNQVFDQRIGSSRYCGFGGGNIVKHIRIQGHVLVLTQGQRRLTIGLQLHGAARRRHDLCICRDAHAFTQRSEVAIRIADPCLAGELRYENGGGCHDLCPSMNVSEVQCLDPSKGTYPYF